VGEGLAGRSGVVVKIIEEVVVNLSWSDLDNLTFHPRPQHKRQPGVHVSQVINWLAGPEGLGLYKERDENEDMPLGVLLGMGFEEVAVRLIPPPFQWQPKPLVKDGLIGSPDGLNWISGEGSTQTIPIIEEFKRTLKSRHTSGNVLLNWPWVSQMQAYCALDPRKPQLARLHVDWDAGDYRPPRAEYRRYLIRFERTEIENNWRLLLKYRDKVTPEGASK
jgi:hypothetical protein